MKDRSPGGLANELRIAFKEDASDVSLRKWGTYICANDIPLSTLLELLDDDRFTTSRFLWMTGGIVEIDPERVKPVVPYFFEKRTVVTVPNYDRSLAKFLWLAGVPEEIEAEAIDALFRWILDPKVITTTKTYAALALQKLVSKHPDLKNELKLVLEDQLDKNGVSFQKRVGKILRELKI
jgi:hypothetical protein